MAKLDPEDMAVRTAVFGEQVQQFLQSDIGDYLLKRAAEEEAAAIEALVSWKRWEDGPTEAELRERIFRARNFQTWLGEAVQRGLQALELLREEGMT